MSRKPEPTETSSPLPALAEPRQPGTVGGESGSRRARAAVATILRGLGIASLSLAIWIPTLAVLAIHASPHSRDRILGAARWPIEGLLISGAIVGFLALLQRVRERPESDPRADRGTDWGFVLRLGLCVGVVCIGIYQGLFPGFRALHAAVWVGLAGSGFGLLVLVVERRSRSPWVRRLDLILFNLCAFVVLGELALRSYAWLRPSVLFERMDSSVSEKIERTRLEPGSLRWGSRVNEDGYLDASPSDPGEREGPFVLSIADSFAIGTTPPFYHFTTVAERALPGVEIYNMGMSGIGPREYLHLLLEEGLGLDPDVVLINLYLGNDFNGPVPGTRDGAVLAPFFDRRNLLLYQVPRRLRLLRSGTSPGAAQAAAGSPPVHEQQGELRTEAEILRAFPWLESPLEQKPLFTDAEILRIERDYALTASRMSQASYSRHLDRSLLPIRQAVGDRTLLVMLIPANYQVDDQLWERISRNPPRPLNRDNARRCVARWLRWKRIPYLDLLPEMRAVAPLEDGRPHLYRNNDTHFNRRGSEVAGKALAAFLGPHVRDPGPVGA
ncbi:MAG: hypothetical protein MI919_23445 [Holophagales bacterium]|nr:hypothetical protein [Holophagales bacterium]